MLLDLLLNPWVIIIVVVAIVVGNIAALRSTANLKVSTMSDEKKQTLERLKKLDEERHKHLKEKSPNESEGGE